MAAFPVRESRSCRSFKQKKVETYIPPPSPTLRPWPELPQAEQEAMAIILVRRSTPCSERAQGAPREGRGCRGSNAGEGLQADPNPTAAAVNRLVRTAVSWPSRLSSRASPSPLIQLLLGSVRSQSRRRSPFPEGCRPPGVFRARRRLAATRQRILRSPRAPTTNRKPQQHRSRCAASCHRPTRRRARAVVLGPRSRGGPKDLRR